MPVVRYSGRGDLLGAVLVWRMPGLDVTKARQAGRHPEVPVGGMLVTAPGSKGP